MEDVSDPPFRALCKAHGADLMFTEFISAEGLIRDADKSLEKLDIYDYERPIGIQIFGDKIDSMRRAAEKAEAANQDAQPAAAGPLFAGDPDVLALGLPQSPQASADGISGSR